MNKSSCLVAVFDLDGTLLDTLDDLTDSVNYAMQTLHLPLHTRQSVRDKIGSGVSVLITRALGKQNASLHNQALQLQRTYYSLHSQDKTHPYPGVVEQLHLLQSEGIKIVVHTNKDESVATKLCAKIFGDAVDCVCGTVDDSAVKPNADRLTKLLQNLHCTKAVYCGDSDVDVATAKNANLPCISVTWGFRTKEFLLESGATHFAETPAQAAQMVLQTLKTKK